MNAPAPPSSLISLTRTSVCLYSRSRAAEEDLPSETAGTRQYRQRRVSKNSVCSCSPNIAELSSSATATRPAGSR